MNFSSTIGSIKNGLVRKDPRFVLLMLKANADVEKLIKFTSIEISGKHYNLLSVFEKAAKTQGLAFSDAILQARKNCTALLEFPVEITTGQVVAYRIEKKSTKFHFTLKRDHQDS